jgi:hypothetical protein
MIGRLAAMRLRALPATIAAIALTGCSGIIPTGTPHDATAIFRPADMVADREAASPGDVVEISFPGEMTRGILFVLEEHAGASWTYRYALLSDGAGGAVSWQPAEADIAVEDVGVGGAGPDRVVIPDTAAPGDYRICTGNALENVCVPIAIRAP